MGDAPSTCTNRYDGKITSFVVSNGTYAFDAVTNSGATLDVDMQGTYSVLFVIHTSNSSSAGGNSSGTTWYDDDAYGYQFGHCVPSRSTLSVGPNQDVSINRMLGHPANLPTYQEQIQIPVFNTFVNSISYSVDWKINSTSGSSSVPPVPQNLQANGGNMQVVLSWSVPSSNGGSTITNYKIYKSTSSGTETLFATIGNVTSYNDGTVTNGQTYFYKVTAVNSVGESSPSNEASATPSSGAGVTVKSVDQNNNAIYGLYTLLCSQGTSGSPDGGNSCETGSSRLASGNTTVTFSGLPAGQTFGVDVYNNATCSFNHWSDNTANTYKFRLFTATNPPSILTPVYSCGTTVPQPPTGLAATVVSSSQINLSWTAPVNNGGSAITGYEVERSRGNLSFGGFSNSTSTTFFSAPNATAFTDDGLSASTTYNYTVFAKNSAGPSSPSNTAYATTSAVTPPPPTGIVLNNIQSTSGTISASPYQITLANFNAGTGSNQLLVVGVSANNNNVVSITFAGAKLTKKISSFSNNDAEFWYLKNSTGTGNIVVTMAGSTSAVVGAYSFSGVNQSSPLPISATNHNSAAGSPTVSLTTTNPNDWVLDLPSIYGGVTLGSPTCIPQWNIHMSNAITGASSSAVQTTAGSVTCSWTASSGEMWDDIAVEVKAYSSGSTGSTTVPSPPTGLAATTVSSSQINLSWTAPTNNGGATITGYKIERSTDSGSTWSSLVANTGSASTKYSDTGLTQSTSYAYRVSAINSAGASAPSNVSSATTPNNITAPSPPTGLTTTTVSSSQINLSWTTPSSNGGSAITGYDVDRSTNNGNSWSTVTSNTGSTTTAYNDTGLSPSTTYTYRVSAINSAGTGSPSNISFATTGTVTTNGIKLDNVQSTSGSTSTSNPIMLADFNVGTGNNRLLVVGVSADNSNVGSITFGGVSLTKKVSSFHNNDAEFWYLVNPTGTGAIVVTMKGTTSAIVGAYSFSGVNQTSPLPTSIANYNSAASSPTVSITAKFANDFILDLPSIYGGVTLGASTGTQQWNTHMPGSITGASSSAMVQSPGSVTCKWTASSGDLWDDVALEVGASK